MDKTNRKKTDKDTLKRSDKLRTILSQKEPDNYFIYY